MPRHERRPSAPQATPEEALSRQQIRAVRRIVGVAAATLTAVAAIVVAVFLAAYR